MATLFYRYAGTASLATIWVHEAAEDEDSENLVSEAGPGVEIRVRGDFGKYHYTFFQEETKIAQVKRILLSTCIMLRLLRQSVFVDTFGLIRDPHPKGSSDVKLSGIILNFKRLCPSVCV